MTQTTDTIDIRELLTARGPLPEGEVDFTELRILRDGLTLTPRECVSTDGSGSGWTEITMPSIEDVEILLVNDPDRSPEWTLAIDASERIQEITIREAGELSSAIYQACVAARVLPARVRA